MSGIAYWGQLPWGAFLWAQAPLCHTEYVYTAADNESPVEVPSTDYGFDVFEVAFASASPTTHFESDSVMTTFTFERE